MATNPRRISSLQQFQRVVPAIVKAINADPELAMRAAANPLLAVEELGYTIEPDVRRLAERRVRFPKATFERLGELEKEIHASAGEQFEIDSSEALSRVLFEKLKLPPPGEDSPQQKSRSRAKTSQKSYPGLRLVTDPLPPRPLGGEPTADPLDGLRKAHPVMKPLLEYRQLEASSARLAPPDLYERIRRGDVKSSITGIKARLKRGPTPE
jgi:hypothetical protein